jgi:hypothetical protein
LGVGVVAIREVTVTIPPPGLVVTMGLGATVGVGSALDVVRAKGTEDDNIADELGRAELDREETGAGPSAPDGAADDRGGGEAEGDGDDDGDAGTAGTVGFKRIRCNSLEEFSKQNCARLTSD